MTPAEELERELGPERARKMARFLAAAREQRPCRLEFVLDFGPFAAPAMETRFTTKDLDGRRGSG